MNGDSRLSGRIPSQHRVPLLGTGLNDQSPGTPSWPRQQRYMVQPLGAPRTSWPQQQWYLSQPPGSFHQQHHLTQQRRQQQVFIAASMTTIQTPRLSFPTYHLVPRIIASSLQRSNADRSLRLRATPSPAKGDAQVENMRSGTEVDEANQTLVEKQPDGKQVADKRVDAILRNKERQSRKRLSETQPMETKRPQLNIDSDEESTPAGLGGESRLLIQFVNLGQSGKVPQTFGKNGRIVPDGLEGTHRMYSQEWRFGITHERAQDGLVLLKWSITNVDSGSRISMVETPHQAKRRQAKGFTICNAILRAALSARIDELNAELKAGNRTPLQLAYLESLVRELRPNKCTQGLLCFGLRHKVVQMAMRKH